MSASGRNFNQYFDPKKEFSNYWLQICMPTVDAKTRKKISKLIWEACLYFNQDTDKKIIRYQGENVVISLELLDPFMNNPRLFNDCLYLIAEFCAQIEN